MPVNHAPDSQATCNGGPDAGTSIADTIGQIASGMWLFEAAHSAFRAGSAIAGAAVIAQYLVRTDALPAALCCAGLSLADCACRIAADRTALSRRPR